MHPTDEPIEESTGDYAAAIQSLVGLVKRAAKLERENAELKAENARLRALSGE